VVTVAVQSIFYLEMYQNNIFFILKKLFLRSTDQNDLKILKKNWQIFFLNLKERGFNHVQMISKSFSSKLTR